MSLVRAKPFAYGRVLACALAFAFIGSHAHAQGSADAEGPFEGLSGSWSGSGTVTLASGLKERLRCQAAYDVGRAGENLQQALRCTSASYDFDLRSNLEVQGGALSGRWMEVTRNASGVISGRARDGQIQAVAQGPGFTANLNLATRGNRQTVTLNSAGAEVSQVSVTLRRGR